MAASPKGMAADVTSGALRLSPSADVAKLPLRVSLQAKLTQATAYNILVAQGLKSSKSHWEVFTEAGSGRLAVYVPGSSPSLFVSEAVVTDGKWHDIDVRISESRVAMRVDGKSALEKSCSRPDLVPDSGEFWVGGYPTDGLTCSGMIDDLQVWRGTTDSAPVVSATFDAMAENGFDASNGNRLVTTSRDIPLKGNIKVKTTVINHGIPVVDARTSEDWRVVGNDSGGMRYSTLNGRKY
jgi:hypothetical protein